MRAPTQQTSDPTPAEGPGDPVRGTESKTVSRFLVVIVSFCAVAGLAFLAFMGWLGWGLMHERPDDLACIGDEASAGRLLSDEMQLLVRSTDTRVYPPLCSDRGVSQTAIVDSPDLQDQVRAGLASWNEGPAGTGTFCSNSGEVRARLHEGDSRTVPRLELELVQNGEPCF